MNICERYSQWCTDDFFDESTKNELKEITDEKEIEDRFYCDLKFGTGGMRGKMGAGTNRLNKYTVGRATAGLGFYLTEQFGKDACLTRGAAIAYDTRNNSKELAEITADILTGMGVKVYIFDKPVPTPELSFTIRQFRCIAGIVITASHNPKEYNGYKVYDENGGQLVVWQAKQLVEYVNRIKDITSVSFEGNGKLKQYIDTTDEFTDAVVSHTVRTEQKNRDGFTIVYTPLHGTGNIPVREALRKSGFNDVHIVTEQEKPNGDFPTVETPNPEVKSSMDMALRLGTEVNADIVLGTDPDCDRVGVGVKQPNGEYILLTGNQIGALIADYVISHTDMTKIRKPALIKTVVTSDLGAELAREKGFTVFETLTGFKYVGEKINQFENAKAEGDTLRDYDFVVGYEESYGYLVGTYARDKDGVGPCLTVCEMAAEYKAAGKTLTDRLEQLYKTYGYYYDAQDSFTFEGKDGIEKMDSMMADLRNGSSPFEDTECVIDYNKPVKAEPGFGELPRSNVLKFILKDGSWIAVRPSGTEPKIKLYYSIKGIDAKTAEKNYRYLREIILSKLDIK